MFHVIFFLIRLLLACIQKDVSVNFITMSTLMLAGEDNFDILFI